MNTARTETELKELLEASLEEKELSYLAKALSRKLLDHPFGACQFILHYGYDYLFTIRDLVSFDEALEIYRQERKAGFVSSGESEARPEYYTDCQDTQAFLVYEWMDTGIKQLKVWLLLKE